MYVYTYIHTDNPVCVYKYISQALLTHTSRPLFLSLILSFAPASPLLPHNRAAAYIMYVVATQKKKTPIHHDECAHAHSLSRPASHPPEPSPTPNFRDVAVTRRVKTRHELPIHPKTPSLLHQLGVHRGLDVT